MEDTMKRLKLTALLALAVTLLLAPPALASPKTTITWLGQSGFRIVTPAGRVLFIDPWFTNTVYPKGKEALESHNRADLIFLTHGHGDHVGNIVQIAKKTGAKLVATQETGRAMVRYNNFPEKQFGVETSGNFGGEFTLLDGDVRVAFVPALHSSSLEIDDDEALPKRHVISGAPAGFVIAVKNGPTIYHTGDTDLFSDMALVQDFGRIDIMMVCIGDKYTMGPRRAAKAVRLVEPDSVIPMHFAPVPPWTGTATQFGQEVRKAVGKDIVTVMTPGESITWEPKTVKRRPR
jgi:L-ascorbate metabolism protein UlaG (beta-lactamase superfamily)